KLREEPGKELLHRGEYIVLLHEAHFQVELIKLAGRPVGAGILVAKARRDLKITVETGNHQQLFELLRRLRQRVKFTGMDARRNQIIACSFRTGNRQDRCLELIEAERRHATANARDDPRAQHDVLMNLTATQIEKAILEPNLLGNFILGEDIE